MEKHKFKPGDQVTWRMRAGGTLHIYTGTVEGLLAPGESLFKLLRKGGDPVASRHIRAVDVTKTERYIMSVYVPCDGMHWHAVRKDILEKRGELVPPGHLVRNNHGVLERHEKSAA